MTLTKKLLLNAALAASLLIPAQTFGAPAPADAKKTAAKAATAAPTAAEIADAKSKGMVWVNLNTKVYHKDGRYYGTTKSGKFMTEADAQKAGYKAAQESPIGKKKTEAKAATAPAKK
ncbi:MAG: signal protein [Acidobacteria bacterium]|nr:signal protein [Acidobacteriota bacterium]